MIQYMLKIQGVSPILMNPATDELLDALFGGAGARKAKATDRTMESVAKEKIIRDENGVIGIPIEYLFSCLVEAGRQIKIDSKRAISTKDSTLLPSFLALEEMFLPFHDQDEPMIVDKRRGKLPKDGTAVCIVRPKFKRWSFDVIISVDEKKIAEDKVRTLFDTAGCSVGLGDFRPSCRGQFGRFRVAEWEKM